MTRRSFEFDDLKHASPANPKHRQAYIGGSWVTATDGSVFSVKDPASNEIIATVPNLTSNEVRGAISAARDALGAWRSTLAHERCRLLKNLHSSMLNHRVALAYSITRESGKPMHEADSEVEYAASYVEWFAEQAKRINGEIIPEKIGDSRILVTREPVGVCAFVTPWNFPLAMITRKLAPALAAGCTAILKPAEETPLTALLLARLFDEIGFPSGVFNVVTTTRSQEVGQILCSSPDVRKISFTGSTEVGRILMRQSSETVKKMSLELGGNAPFIVFETADLDAAVEGAIASKFRNAGQTCVCSNRFLIQRSVYGPFLEKLRERVLQLNVGPGLSETTDVGPLISQKSKVRVLSLVRDAVERGATTICGGGPHDLGGNFVQPTILSDIRTDMSIANEEIFGPVMSLSCFETESEAIDLANSTESGLASYVYSQDMRQIFRVTRLLEFGMVGVNETRISAEVAPFGGVKSSGLGREGSQHGIDEFLELKYVCLGGL